MTQGPIAPGVRLGAEEPVSADDPEDVAQEAFARLHRRWSELRDRPAVGGYLRTIVVNLVRSRQRHLTMARRRREVPDRPEVESAETTALDRVADVDILSALSPRHREALVLRYWLDLSERQIAEAMGTSAGTAKSHLSRGLSVLGAALADIGGV